MRRLLASVAGVSLLGVGAVMQTPVSTPQVDVVSVKQNISLGLKLEPARRAVIVIDRVERPGV